MHNFRLHAIYVGWPKCGSTWLHQLCSASPEITIPPEKDTHYFDENYSKGSAWFESRFPSGANTLPVEIGHDYVFSLDALHRIRDFSPNVKIIVFLRHPYHWILSEYQYVFATGRVSLDFEGYIEEYDYCLKRARYENYLTQLLSVFQGSQIKIAYLEDLSNEPLSFTKNICDFLDIDFHALLDFNPRQQFNSRLTPRIPFSGFLIGAAKRLLVSFGMEKYYGIAKLSVIRNILYKSAPAGIEMPLTCLERSIAQMVATRQALEDITETHNNHWLRIESELSHRLERRV